MSEQRLYKAAELASILGLHIQTIYRMGEKGIIPTYKIGRSVRFEMPDKRVIADIKED